MARRCPLRGLRTATGPEEHPRRSTEVLYSARYLECLSTILHDVRVRVWRAGGVGTNNVWCCEVWVWVRGVQPQCNCVRERGVVRDVRRLSVERAGAAAAI